MWGPVFSIPIPSPYQQTGETLCDVGRITSQRDEYRLTYYSDFQMNRSFFPSPNFDVLIKLGLVHAGPGNFTPPDTYISRSPISPCDVDLSLTRPTTYNYLQGYQNGVPLAVCPGFHLRSYRGTCGGTAVSSHFNFLRSGPYIRDKAY